MESTLIQLTDTKKFIQNIDRFQNSDVSKTYKHVALSGPSCSGKSTLLFKDENSIIKRLPHVYSFSVSGTTRPMRGAEIHGKDYFFFQDREAFAKHRYLETNDYAGNNKLYGTLESEVARIAIEEQKCCGFDVDINGGLRLKQIFDYRLLFIFLWVPIEVLEKRFYRRRTETGETVNQINQRLDTAIIEQERVKVGDVVPDIKLHYDDTMLPEQAVRNILPLLQYSNAY